MCVYKQVNVNILQKSLLERKQVEIKCGLINETWVWMVRNCLYHLNVAIGIYIQKLQIKKNMANVS